jgi:hypothetical protein
MIRYVLMLRKTFALTLLAILVSACASKQEAPSVSGNPPTGTWLGDYDPGSGRREPISVDLRWDNETLRGTVHAGPRSLPLSKATFQQATGAVTMEFDTEDNRGRTVHYVIDGKISGNTMKGTWSHDQQRGEFRVTKQ